MNLPTQAQTLSQNPRFSNPTTKKVGTGKKCTCGKKHKTTYFKPNFEFNYRTHSSVIARKIRKKYLSQSLNTQLFALDSPLKKYYENATKCCNFLIQKEQKLTSSYCNCRTCYNCNGVRTGFRINWYGEQLLALEDPQFITLTAPTVRCLTPKELRDAINFREKIWRKIYKKAQKLNISFDGVKVIEVTTRENHYYHPHFHLIIDNKETAQWIIEQWLKLIPEASPLAQKIEPVTSPEALLELFKYQCKMTTEVNVLQVDGSYKKEEQPIDIVRLDLVTQALYRKRTLATFGTIKRSPNEDKEEENLNDIVKGQTCDELEYSENTVIWQWIHALADYVSRETGELLSSFIKPKPIPPKNRLKSLAGFKQKLIKPPPN